MHNVREKLIRVSQLVDGGELERDLALQLLREAYAELKFGSERLTVNSEQLAAQSEPYIETEHVVFQVEPIEEPEPQFDPVPEPFVPRPAVRPEVIRSLYGDATPPAVPKPEPTTPGAAPRTETIADTAAPTTLGDALRPEARDVASAAAAAATPVGASLRKAIGLNDRFVMIRDMFRGDTAAFDRTIDQLDRFGGMDEAVIWLHDNLALDPDSEGVGLLMSLLERRFS